MEGEEWRPVVGWEDLYEVSNSGRVRSLDRVTRNGRGYFKKPGRVLKGSFATRRGNYLIVDLSRGGKRVRKPIHRLVCEAFHGPPPENKPHALHWDDNPVNNWANNLRWGSDADNARDKERNRGPGNHKPHLTHCKWGHEFSEENTRITRRGHRVCKECARDRKITYRKEGRMK